jgi:hypothetical protein
MTFTPDDDACQSAGEGITRTSEPGAKFWPVQIHWPGCRPMRCTIRATCKTAGVPVRRAPAS